MSRHGSNGDPSEGHRSDGPSRHSGQTGKKESGDESAVSTTTRRKKESQMDTIARTLLAIQTRMAKQDEQIAAIVGTKKQPPTIDAPVPQANDPQAPRAASRAASRISAHEERFTAAQKGKGRAHDDDGAGDEADNEAETRRRRRRPDPFEQLRATLDTPTRDKMPATGANMHVPHTLDDNMRALEPLRDTNRSMMRHATPAVDHNPSHIDSNARAVFTMLPSFSGDDDIPVDQWITQVNTGLDGSPVSTEYFVSLLSTKLRGSAKSWYFSLTDEERHSLFTWELWISRLRNDFRPPRYAQRARDEARNYKWVPSVSVREYFWKKIRLLRYANLDLNNDDIMHEVMAGFPELFAAQCTMPPNIDLGAAWRILDDKTVLLKTLAPAVTSRNDNMGKRQPFPQQQRAQWPLPQLPPQQWPRGQQAMPQIMPQPAIPFPSQAAPRAFAPRTVPTASDPNMAAILAQARTFRTTQGAPPPLPCRNCGGDHWNRECPAAAFLRVGQPPARMDDNPRHGRPVNAPLPPPPDNVRPATFPNNVHPSRAAHFTSIVPDESATIETIEGDDDKTQVRSTFSIFQCHREPNGLSTLTP